MSPSTISASLARLAAGTWQAAAPSGSMLSAVPGCYQGSLLPEQVAGWQTCRIPAPAGAACRCLPCCVNPRPALLQAKAHPSTITHKSTVEANRPRTRTITGTTHTTTPLCCRLQDSGRCLPPLDARRLWTIDGQFAKGRRARPVNQPPAAAVGVSQPVGRRPSPVASRQPPVAGRSGDCFASCG